MEETPQGIKICIGDNGQGIDPDELPFVFDIYHRGKTAAVKTGAGIGLAAVKAIVACHGGRVTVASEAGRGSVFTVVLPENLHREKGI